jgi:hypothetical protein
MRSQNVVLLIGLATALLTGCQSAGEVTAPAVSTAGVGAPPSPLGAGEAADGLDASPVASPRSVALLTDVRAARQDGFDRVTFEFAEEAPSYDVRLGERPVLASGSGEEVQVDGEEVLLVRLEPASGFDLEAATEVYEGPTRIVADTATITEVVRAGDFEGQLEWAVGLRGPADYEVTVYDDPARIVLDVRHEE